MPSLIQWKSTWEALGVISTDALTPLFHELMARYEEPHRKYHAPRHLDECFDRLRELRELAFHPAEIEMALWFHDAVYDSTRSDNEQASADYARSSAKAAGVSDAAADRVHSLVMFTRHSSEPVGRDAEILVDVDLAILGAEPERFEEYERQVREEYLWVPEATFRLKRAEILRKFMLRPFLFHTERFVQRYEPQARANIALSLERLET